MVEYNSEIPVIPNLQAFKFLTNRNTKREYIISRQIIKTRLWFFALWSKPDCQGDESDKIFQTVVNNRVVAEMSDALVIQEPFSLRLVSDLDFDLL